MIRTIRRLLKELFYNGAGTLSLSRVALAVAVVQADAIVWLAVLWAYHLTTTGQMEAGAQLVSAYFTGLGTILGAQVTGAVVAQVFQMKFGSGSISGRQLDIADARTAILAGEEPARIPEIGPELVPSDPDEPRIAAEIQSSESSTVTVTADAPIPVELTEGEKQ